MQTVEHRDESHDLNAQQARQGATLGVMRYVLAISTIAVVIVFALIWLYGV